jgi:hypothetical protein
MVQQKAIWKIASAAGKLTSYYAKFGFAGRFVCFA